MKYFHLYILLFLLIFSYVQFLSNDEETHKVEVYIPNSYLEYLSYPRIVNQNEDIVEYYDSKQLQFVSIFDSVPKGDETITIFSLLTNDYYKTINIEHDTSIFFDTLLYSSFKFGNVKDLFNLNTKVVDTFFIGQKSSGYLGSYAEKMKIFKVDSTYMVCISNNNDISETEIHSINEEVFNIAFLTFIKECNKLTNKKINIINPEAVIIATLNTNTYIRLDDYIYVLPQNFYWEGYRVFKESIEQSSQNKVTEYLDTLFSE